MKAETESPPASREPSSQSAVPAGAVHKPGISGWIGRVASIDAYRGLVMLLMMGEVLELRRVAERIPGSRFWEILAHHQSHVAWIGCSLHDMIQPSFSFLVGVALPFSVSRRAAEGQPQWRRTAHAFWRALVLVLLGVFLRSTGASQTHWTFEDTLTQIGLGYGFLYLIALRSARFQWSALAFLLIGYWLAFALYPVPGPDFDWTKAGVKPESVLPGFAAHWSLNTNFAWAFDTWFMNLFPRKSPFTHNGGGYSTLSFIPTLGTMVLGLLAGGVLRSDRKPMAKVVWLGIAGLAALAAGWLLGLLGICPVVKRIWTPSWVLFSGGWCFLFLGAFYLVLDVWNRRSWAFFLVVVGMNSIAAYLIAHLFEHFIKQALPRHLGAGWYSFAGPAYESLLLGAGVLLVEWLLLFWMYRRKIFLRI
jgi:heparan-alpha-glucosaminide N-acetyltransferase